MFLVMDSGIPYNYLSLSLLTRLSVVAISVSLYLSVCPTFRPYLVSLVSSTFKSIEWISNRTDAWIFFFYFLYFSMHTQKYQHTRKTLSFTPTHTNIWIIALYWSKLPMPYY